MDDAARARIAGVEQYRDDLLRFGEMLLENNRLPDFAALRRSIIQRGGAIRPLCERVVGGYAMPQTSIFGRLGPDVNIWDLALRPTGHFDTPDQQAKFATQVGDLLTELLGRLEADPSLLDPPKPPEPRREPPPSGAQAINIHGGTVNIAQTLSGDVTQTNSAATELAEVRRLLNELSQAIAELEAPEDERESVAAPVDTLKGELRQPKPLAGRMLTAYGAVTAFATAESAWQGWERVQRISGELAPLLHNLIQSATQ